MTFEDAITMLRMLRRGVTMYEAADARRVNRRTIQREIAALQALGFDVRAENEAHGLKVWRAYGAAKTIQSMLRD